MLHRELDQVPMANVLRHPLADEMDDYIEYRRLRALHKPHRVRFGDQSPGPGEEPPLKAGDWIVREEISKPEDLLKLSSVVEAVHSEKQGDVRSAPSILAPSFNDAVLARRVRDRKGSRSKVSANEDDDEADSDGEYKSTGYASPQGVGEVRRVKEKRVMVADEGSKSKKQRPGLRGTQRSGRRSSEKGLSPRHVLPYPEKAEKDPLEGPFFVAGAWLS